MALPLPYPSMRYATLLFTCLMLLLAGCASRSPVAPESMTEAPAAIRAKQKARSGNSAPDLQAQQEMDALVADVMAEVPPLRVSLEAQHEDWKGVPYRYGGLSPRGVDCSGFVYLTFLSRLGMEVPRTTTELLQSGEKVKRDEIQVGDLVFFRTGPGNRHVGIYMGNGDFLHASSSQGVMTSSLSNPYWHRRYWQARRLAGL
ncbi:MULTISPECIES: NlpC/P60 family protein [unclassified Alcanivorax]|uniref:NlpC/P60 family protein n=1 Tax=unclassified Alcanivorax TaxID=2638842 RepID=UPI00089FD3BD|nr:MULTISPECIES: NlpC/P60 family protein [unclassified Alcanivorax]MEE2604345.1 NlpC/P60 family protein [Pseudomonadota bacterium]MEE3387152.1 NlpC/P60 family protein [Pseudomonadota bacterium]SEF94093.1 probable lipoprotein NlpC [Alcanivorax sp. DSM 26293]